MMQRHTFAKGYITQQRSHNGKYLRVEESYAGQHIEIFVGNNNEDTNCTCDCGCTPFAEHSVDLTREQLKELVFCLKQLHFIDRESK